MPRSAQTQAAPSIALSFTRVHSKFERNLDEDLPAADWNAYAELVKEHDEALVRGWKEEIDTLLVFAGLFSAVVTTFNAEAYKLLQQDPSERTEQLLARISEQLAATQSGAQLGNMTTDSTAFAPSTQSIRINALWFSSLVCSLFAALTAIMVKQWLRQYVVPASMSPRESVRLRQYRFDGLIAWHVDEIMGFSPVLLEIALILFLVGLADFLHSLQATVAGIVISLVALSLIFYVATTIIPAIYPGSPFKSPQSWLIFRCCRRMMHWYADLHLPPLKLKTAVSPGHTGAVYESWAQRDNSVVQSADDMLELKALVWVHRQFNDAYFLNSIPGFIPELRPETAASLVYEILAQGSPLSAGELVAQVRSRSCERVLQDMGANTPVSTLTRTFRMLLAALAYIPREAGPEDLSAIDVLWTVWSLHRGFRTAEFQDARIHSDVVTALTALTGEDEPFRLRRAAVNLLWELIQEWRYMYRPDSIGHAISCAREWYRGRVSDMFTRACVVAIVLSSQPPEHGRAQDDEAAHERGQLKELLRELERFLRQCNETSTEYDHRATGRMIFALAALAEQDADLVDAALVGALREGADVGVAAFTLDERLALHGLEAMGQTSGL